MRLPPDGQKELFANDHSQVPQGRKHGVANDERHTWMRFEWSAFQAFNHCFGYTPGPSAKTLPTLAIGTNGRVGPKDDARFIAKNRVTYSQQIQNPPRCIKAFPPTVLSHHRPICCAPRLRRRGAVALVKLLICENQCYPWQNSLAFDC